MKTLWKRVKELFERLNLFTMLGFLFIIVGAPLLTITHVETVRYPGFIGGIPYVQMEQYWPTTVPINFPRPVFYSPITMVSTDGRDVIQLLKPIQPDYIMRAYWKWSDTSKAYYDAIEKKIAEVKKEIPNAKIGGFLPTQFLPSNEIYANGTLIPSDIFDSMLLRCKDGEPISHYRGFIPDWRNKDYQDYFVGWAKKLAKGGVDIIHLDGKGIVLSNAIGCEAISKPEDLEAYWKTIVNRIRNEAGVLVTANNPAPGKIDVFDEQSRELGYGGYPSLWSELDFIDGQASPKDFDPPYNVYEDYTRTREDMIKVYGRTLSVNVFLDYAFGDPNQPLSRLARIPLEDRKIVLQNIDRHAKANGASFIYPVLGGAIDSEKWDSVKFGVYDTIVELAKSATTTTTSRTTLSPTTTTTSTTPSPRCVIAAATHGTFLVGEVEYIRNVRDGMIGSTVVGRMIINCWNSFYYSWSPPLAESISRNQFLKCIFQIALLPLLGIIHLTAVVFLVGSPLSREAASAFAFSCAIVMTVAIYLLCPIYMTVRLSKSAYSKISQGWIGSSQIVVVNLGQKRTITIGNFWRKLLRG